MKNLKKLLIALPFLGVTITAHALPVTVNFSPAGIGTSPSGTMDGVYAYKWGVNWSVPAGNSISAATLTYSNVKLTGFGKNNPGILWSNLLDTSSGSGTTGVTKTNDSDASSDYWGTTGLLGKELFPTLNVAHNFSYALDLAMLTNYAADGHFAIGIDPDCHYTTSSIKLSITYDKPTPSGEVPDGGSSALLLGIVLPFLRLFRRSK
ncbi:MAG: hypothetical protein NTV46_07560 [Verrucomicrobia bacterium]|nr:hypothetical protein [Verrucomicrobiota bacterium]